MKNSFLFLFITLGILSCQRENSTQQCIDNTRIRNIKSGNIQQKQYGYNENCQVSELVEAFQYSKYTYDPSNRIIKSEYAFSLNPASCYMPQGIQGENVSDPRKAKISSYSVFEYNMDGKLNKKSNYYFGNAITLTSVNTFVYKDSKIIRLNIENPDNVVTQYYLYTYDESGNLVHEEYYFTNDGIDGTIVSSTDYVFDNWKNPFFTLASSGEPGINTNPNNITKETITYYYSGSAYPHTRDYQIEYNTAGYPVKVDDLVYSYGN